MAVYGNKPESVTGVGCGLPTELVSWLQFPDPTRLPRCFLVQQKQPKTARSGELPDGERGHLKTTHHEKRYNNHNNEDILQCSQVSVRERIILLKMYCQLHDVRYAATNDTCYLITRFQTL